MPADEAAVFRNIRRDGVLFTVMSFLRKEHTTASWCEVYATDDRRPLVID
jgi:hypothetical protein